MVGVEAKSNNWSIEFFKNTDNSLHFSLILSVLSKELFFVWSLDDIFVDCQGLGKFEVSLYKVGDVREIETKLELIFFEPFVLVVVLDLLEVCLCVGKKESAELSESSDFPVSDGDFGHKICFIN